MSRPPQAHLAQVLALLPPGAAWPKDPDSVLARVLLPLADALATLDGGVDTLLDEADPRTAFALLADWEAMAGLPDPCSGAAVGLEARRQAVVARLTARGGQSRAYFIALAAALGWTVTIEEFRPATCESSGETPLYDEDWRFTWRVRAAAVPIGEATCGADCETPLRWWGNRPLECTIRRGRPAHTHVLFGYGE